MKNFIKINRALVAEKNFILFLVAMVTMMWAGMSTALAYTDEFQVNGQEFSVKDGTTDVGGITVEQRTGDKELVVDFSGVDAKTLEVDKNNVLISYSGDDFETILVLFDKNLTINHSTDGSQSLFDFEGTGSEPLNVYFANNNISEDVTLNINTTTEEDNCFSVFFLVNTKLYLNTTDINDKTKLNLDFFSCGTVFNAGYTDSYINLGYGDYHFAFDNWYGVGNVFDGYIKVTGLGDCSKGEEHNYASIPAGIYCIDGDEASNKDCALYDCALGSTDFNNKYTDELILKYVPVENWEYFDEENNSDYKFSTTCDGLTLYIKGAGDLSSLDPDELPWKPYKDFITNVVVSSDLMIPLTKLPDAAFSDFTVLKKASLDGVYDLEEVSPKCFYSCPFLEEVTFSYMNDKLTSIGEYAFYVCTNLYSIEIPEHIEEIGNNAFVSCYSLGTITLPEGLKSVGEYAFQGCSFVDITLPTTLKNVGSDAFGYCKTLRVPKGIGEVEVMDGGGSVFYGTNSSLYYEGTSEDWLAGDFKWLMYNKTQYAIAHLFFDGSEVVDLVIPEGITEVKDYAFAKCTGLKSVSFPSTLTKIGECSFWTCTGFTGLSLPESITSIGMNAFYHCTNLAAVETKAIVPVTLGENAFKDIDENAVLKVYKSAVSAYEASDWAKYFKIEGALADYTVTAASSDKTLGEVTLTFDDKDVISKGEEPNTFIVLPNAKGHLVATPKDKYTEFVIWNDESEDIYKAERDITVTGDFDYIATFHKDSFNVVVSVEGIDPELVVINGAGKYGRGDNVTLTYKLNDEHYDFEEWHFDKNNFEDEATLVFEEIDADHDVQIVFKAKYYTVSATVIPAEGGIVKGQGEYEYGTDYTLTLEPADGWELKEWRDGEALEETSNVLTGLVYGDITIECVLQQNIVIYTVTFLDWDATVLLVEKVEEGKDAKGPDPDPTREGYKFVGWSKPITNITADLTVIAQYEKSGTGLDEIVNRQSSIRKFIREGQIFIIRGNKVYTVDGQMVK